MSKLINLGCKLNQYEGHALNALYQDQPDIIIVNTCCVTKGAEVKSLRKFRHARRMNPGARIIATGCACRRDPLKYDKAYQIIDNIKRLDLIQGVKPEPEKARYFLKIQDGCDGKCNYCVVPRVRDRLISKNVENVLTEIKWAQDRHYNEIVLVGANLGLYGIGQDYDLIQLCNEISRLKNRPRLRLSSIEPRFITAELLTVLAAIAICPHFHIPIQSADDYILKQMGRFYTAADLEQKIEMINKNFQRPAIGADIIVGYPGETDSRFNNTFAFIEKGSFTHLHVFSYSPRPGTTAFDLGDPIPGNVKKERLHALYDLIRKKQQCFKTSMSGSTADIIIDRTGRPSSGLSEHYIRVRIEDNLKTGSMHRVKLSIAGEELIGSIDDH